ncbi:ENTH/VHS family protein isoform X2 [Tasmannia lanceolata]|uniref:ENTH/VHS family protein isoform X2 n=1 Tax=Tasmannia lanceolata TaxID=3420 RepID=UPI004063CD02
MNGAFNGQILIDKLAKLNSTQQSIETLSHWCIFHRKRAKQVVETWDRQFYCSQREKRVSFLYLANDILQNSRRKGSEFVWEFWKVLPEALSDVLEKGDEFSRNVAMRLVDIWDERKVFGSRGQILKEELMGRTPENSSRNGKKSDFKLKQSIGGILEKIISSYEAVYDDPLDEDSVLSKCRTGISCVEKVEKEISGDYNAAHFNDFVEELQEHSGVLRKCIEQLRSAESSRANLVSHLKEALQEEELELEKLRNQLQVAQSQSDRSGSICQQLLSFNGGHLVTEQRSNKVTTFSDVPPSFIPEAPIGGGEKEKSAPVMYIQPGPSFTDNSLHTIDERRKTTAAEVAAKLAASTSSAQMLSYVLSSLASEGVIGNPLNGSAIKFPSEKRPKLENGQSSYSPSQNPPPLPPFPHPGSVQKLTTFSQQMTLNQPSPHPSSSPMSNMQTPPPLPPMPPPSLPPQFMQTAGSMTSVPYGYGTAPQGQPPLPGYPMVGTQLSGISCYPSPYPYQNQAPDSGFYNKPPLPATPPTSRS